MTIFGFVCELVVYGEEGCAGDGRGKWRCQGERLLAQVLALRLLLVVAVVVVGWNRAIVVVLVHYCFQSFLFHLVRVVCWSVIFAFFV